MTCDMPHKTCLLGVKKTCLPATYDTKLSRTVIKRRIIVVRDIDRMPSIEEKSIRVIKFSSSSKGWEIWSEKFKVQRKRKGYTKLLLGWVEIPTQDKLTATEGGKSDSDKKVMQLGDLNELGYEDLICQLM